MNEVRERGDTMNEITGSIEEIDGPNAGGYYRLAIEGVLYTIGKTAPSVAVGDVVTFGFTTKQKGRWTNHTIIANTLKVVPPEEAAVVTAQSTKSSPPRDRITRYHAARMSAIELMALVLKYEVFPTGTKGKGLDIVVGKVYDLTTTFYNDSAELPDMLDIDISAVEGED